MTLSDFIKSLGGDEAAAVLLDVEPRTVMSWRLGDRTPRPSMAQKIVARSEGRITLEDIYTQERA